jgi:hypothetical protein
MHGVYALYTFELDSKGAAMDILRHAGIFALLTLAIDLIPVAMAVVYVVRPTERNLALMRPFSLAGARLFARAPRHRGDAGVQSAVLRRYGDRRG